MDVLSFVNGGTSTSFQVEISAKIDEITDANVEIASFYDSSVAGLDPDVADLDTTIHLLGANSRFDITAYRRLRSLLTDFDILHTHYNSVGSIGRLASFNTNIDIVNTEHNDHRHFSNLQNITNCITYPCIDTMVLNSQSTLNSLQWYERPFLFQSDVTTIYNGIDFDRIDNAISYIDPPELPDGPKIVTASTITKQKNLQTLVHAMKFVVDRVPSAELIIIGDGPLKNDIEALTHEIGVSESTTFLGYLPEREQVYSTIHECDIFAVPSAYEGFCNAAVEAMGCGLPVVASDIPVLREVVAEGGCFADPTNPKAFSQELITILLDNSFANKLSNEGKEYSRSEYSIEKSANTYYKLYSSIISS